MCVDKGFLSVLYAMTEGAKQAAYNYYNLVVVMVSIELLL